MEGNSCSRKWRIDQPNLETPLAIFITKSRRLLVEQAEILQGNDLACAKMRLFVVQAEMQSAKSPLTILAMFSKKASSLAVNAETV